MTSIANRTGMIKYLVVPVLHLNIRRACRIAWLGVLLLVVGLAVRSIWRSDRLTVICPVASFNAPDGSSGRYCRSVSLTSSSGAVCVSLIKTTRDDTAYASWTKQFGGGHEPMTAFVAMAHPERRVFRQTTLPDDYPWIAVDCFYSPLPAPLPIDILRYVGIDAIANRFAEPGYPYEWQDVVGVTVPYWFIIPLLGAPSLRWGWKRYVARRWRRDQRCTTCGYDLRATPDRCPECGSHSPSA